MPVKCFLARLSSKFQNSCKKYRNGEWYGKRMSKNNQNTYILAWAFLGRFWDFLKILAVTLTARTTPTSFSNPQVATPTVKPQQRRTRHKVSEIEIQETRQPIERMIRSEKKKNRSISAHSNALLCLPTPHPQPTTPAPPSPLSHFFPSFLAISAAEQIQQS